MVFADLKIVSVVQREASSVEHNAQKRSWADESERTVEDDVADAWRWTLAFGSTQAAAAACRPARAAGRWNRQVTEDEDACEYDLVERSTFLHAVPRTRASRMPRSRSCPSMLSLADVHGALEMAGATDSRRRPASWGACGSEHVSETSSERGNPPSCSSVDGSASPKASTASSEDGDEPLCWDGVSIVMMRNIPCRCDQQEVLKAIQDVGFNGLFAFCYLPVKRGHQQNSGFAFVGFHDAMLAIKFRDAMTGYSFPSRKSNKVVAVVPARIQGLEQASILFKKTWAVGEMWSGVMPEGLQGQKSSKKKGQQEAGAQ